MNIVKNSFQPWFLGNVWAEALPDEILPRITKKMTQLIGFGGSGFIR